MNDILWLLETAVRPYEVADRMGAGVRHVGGSFVADCPFCGQQLWLTNDSFLCRNDECTALVGSSLELAYGYGAQNSETIEQALRRIQACWEPRLAKYPELASATATPSILRGYRLRRKIIRWLRGLRQASTMNTSKVAVLDSLHQAGIQEPDKHVFYPASPEELDQLDLILMELNCVPPKRPPGRHLLVTPFGAKLHEVTTLVLMDPGRSWQARIDLRTCPVVFGGLWHLSQDVTTTMLCSTPVQAALLNHSFKVLSGKQVAVSYLWGEEHQQRVVPDLQGPVLCHDLKQALPTHAVRFQELYPNLRVTTGKQSAPLSYLDFAMQQLARHVRPGATDLASAGLLVLGCLNPQGQLRNQLHQQMLQRGWAGAADQLVRDRYVIELQHTDKGVLLSTPEGYAVRRKANQQDTVTNFTVRFIRTVMFGDTAPHYEVEVLLGTEQFQTIIPTRMLDTPRDLAAHLQVVAAAKDIQGTPFVQDNNAFRQLTYYWRAIIPKLTTTHGTPFLGWDARMTAFLMPGCQITLDGTTYDNAPMHPDITTLDAFEVVQLPSTDLGSLPRDLRTLILLVLGSIIAVHRRMRVRPVHIRHDGNAARTLDLLFRGMGQMRPVTKLMNRLPGLAGYPAYATANTRTTGSIQEPFFVLQDHGITLQANHQEELLLQAAGTLRRLVIRVVEALLAAPSPHEWVRPNTVLWSNELILTAQQLLAEQAGVVVDAELTTFEWTEKLLKQIPKENIPEVFSYDFAKQIVSIKGDTFKQDIDFVRLELELRALADEVKIDTGHLIHLDARSAMGILNQYYGEIPYLQTTTQ